MSIVKSPGSTWELQSKLQDLNVGEVGGIPSGEVKFVEIRWNTRGEGA
jgi:hypothetical protein